MRTRQLFLVGGMLLLGFLLVAPTFAQQPDGICDAVEYFPQTGHNVCDEFLAFLKARGGAEIFGYPITEAFYENGRLVQYFQRARMEYHPELIPAHHVQLGLLGDQFAPTEQKTRVSRSDASASGDFKARFFPETGHSIAFQFREFFDKNGGLDIFGYPVTEYFVQTDRNLQYYQRALMEWDPNRGIVLHNIGEMWVDQDKHLSRLRDVSTLFAFGAARDALDVEAGNLVVSISLRDAYVGSSGEQKAWVYVNDPGGAPIAGAEVRLVAPFRSGLVDVGMPPTDADGHTEVTFSLPGQKEGQRIILDALVSYEGLTTQARTSFLTWK